MRQRLGLPSRRPSEQPLDIPVKVLRDGFEPLAARLPTDQHNIFGAFVFESPSILEGKSRDDYPAARISVRIVGPDPQFVFVGGAERAIRADEKIEIPVDLDAGDVAQFLAKVAHGFTIYQLGTDACEEYFLPSIVRGNVRGALTYVGIGNPQQNVRQASGTHVIWLEQNGGLLSAFIQLFRLAEGRPPVYQVVVGRVKSE
jgi:hypothetical protein